MALSRAVQIGNDVYRYHVITEIKHVVPRVTQVRVRSYMQEGGRVFRESTHAHEYDSGLDIDAAYEWIAGLDAFAVYIDERDALIEELAPTLTDEQALTVPWAFQPWSPDGEYSQGDRRTYNGALYRCLQSHSGQAGWSPEAAPSLWAMMLTAPVPGEIEAVSIPVWAQPDSTNPYMSGDRVHYPTADDPVYESTIDNNVWSPSAYPAGWTVVG